MKFLRNWLGAHVEGADKKYGPFLNAREVSYSERSERAQSPYGVS